MNSKSGGNDVKPKKLIGIGDGPRNAGNAAPITVFKNLLTDFAGGIRSLQSIASQRRENNPTQPAQPNATVGQKTSSSSTIREKDKPLHLQSTNVATRNVVQHSSVRTNGSTLFRDVSKIVEKFSSHTKTLAELGIPKASFNTAALHSKVRRAVVSGADKEAHKQINEKYRHDSVHHMPAPARLAQILHADALVRRGEGQPSAELHALAEAVRGGQRREVADMDPERVQAVLNHAMGGPSRAAQTLNTPFVNSIVERHQNTIKTLQSSLNEKKRATLTETSIKPKASNVTKQTGLNNAERFTNTLYGDAGIHAPELLSMAATNDEPHLHAAAAAASGRMSEAVRAYRNSDRVIGNSSPGGGSSSGGNGNGNGNEAQSLMNESALQSRPPAKTNMASKTLSFSSISPSGSAQQVLGQMSQSNEKQNRKQELTGKLRLFGENGQALGSALMEGEM